jgi:anaerobic ribonucleoside-triphosphate reductase
MQMRQSRIRNKKTIKREKKEKKMNPQTQRTPCETFSRSMGYIRPVKNFNIGKYSEFCERKTFTESNSLTAGARHRELLKKAA